MDPVHDKGESLFSWWRIVAGEALQLLGVKMVAVSYGGSVVELY